MTQFFSSSTSSTLASEKRAFSGVPVSSNKQVSGANSQVSQKIRKFFRMSSASSDSKEKDKEEEPRSIEGSTNSKSSLRQSRFIPHLGRNRSTTVASEGNTLDDTVSPIAHANPYFQHQGPPTLRHHNDGSVPPSPPDTPGNMSQLDAVSGAQDQQIAASKDELNRKLRRVASAPNAQGLFKPATPGESPSMSNLSEVMLAPSHESTRSMVETVPVLNLLSVPTNGPIPSPGQIRNSVAFRRTYSSNSIKVRNVEVGPGSFDKIKLIGKGDVGKVYLVREKKSSRLYAMKGERTFRLKHGVKLTMR